MTEAIEIRWGDEDAVVPGSLEAGSGPVGVLLAPGAGAGRDHPFMVAVRSGLAALGITTLAFDYAYRAAGRKAPDRLPKLLAVHEAAYQRLSERVSRVVLVGKSMGGRVGSHLAGGVEGAPGSADPVPAGLVYLGYPLVPIGSQEPRAVDHLGRIAAPQLFVSGSRDRMAPLHLIEEVVGSLTGARLHVIDDADHGFHVPKRTGRTSDDVLAEIVEVVAGFAAQASGGM
jgi:predicted alpha/beta-hydrolase family hydrolase